MTHDTEEGRIGRAPPLRWPGGPMRQLGVATREIGELSHPLGATGGRSGLVDDCYRGRDQSQLPGVEHSTTLDSKDRGASLPTLTNDQRHRPPYPGPGECGSPQITAVKSECAV